MTRATAATAATTRTTTATTTTGAAAASKVTIFVILIQEVQLKMKLARTVQVTAERMSIRSTSSLPSACRRQQVMASQLSSMPQVMAEASFSRQVVDSSFSAREQTAGEVSCLASIERFWVRAIHKIVGPFPEGAPARQHAHHIFWIHELDPQTLNPEPPNSQTPEPPNP